MVMALIMAWADRGNHRNAWSGLHWEAGAPWLPSDYSLPPALGMDMNKTQLIEAVADKLGGRQQAAEAVDAVLDAMLRAVDAGERVSVTGIGSFEKADWSAS